MGFGLFKRGDAADDFFVNDMSHRRILSIRETVLYNTIIFRFGQEEGQEKPRSSRIVYGLDGVSGWLWIDDIWMDVDGENGDCPVGVAFGDQLLAELFCFWRRHRLVKLDVAVYVGV